MNRKELKMAVNIGDTSGCLEVIEFEKSYEDDIRKIFYPKAKEFWSGDSLKYDWNLKRYELSASEKKKYFNAEEMPDSFVDKYIAHCSSEPPFLYHKKNPNTICEFYDGRKNKSLIKVRCNKCGRIFFTDEESFKCVKWKICLKIECDKSSTIEKEIDYSTSLYQWDKTSLQVLNNQLEKVDEITKPLPYYNTLMDSGAKTKIAYISDIHLLHHFSNDLNKIRIVCKNLYSSTSFANILLFNGDITSDPEVFSSFFREFVKRYSYIEFKTFVRDMHYYKRMVQLYFKKENDLYVLTKPSIFEKKLETIEKYLQSMYAFALDEYGFDCKLFYKYINQYCYGHINADEAFLKYKNTNGYKKQNVKKSKESEIIKFLIQLDRFVHIAKSYREKISLYYERMNRLADNISLFEEKYSTPIEEVSIANFKRKHDLRKDFGINAYVILGNHEFVKFPDIQSGVNYYNRILSNLGITLLHNSSDCIHNDSVRTKENNILIYGGTGFAKYNPYFNADTIVCCPGFSREDEINETEKFEKGYFEALSYAKENNMTFVCASHYPIDSCLNNNFDAETIYFTGHNHRNEYVYTEDKALYADNQIGYSNERIYFKIANIGVISNPYYFLQDGLYETNVTTYLEFYRYLGEYIGDGAMLYKKCDGVNSNLYVVKHRGYYGFFIVSTGNATKRGIFIVNGGKIKKITTSPNLSWICENFDVVLIKYLQLLTPLRIAQEKISEELKDLGLSGTIHGTIVDIDFYHHIMVNPLDGTIVFYYSPYFGLVQNLDTFEDVIKSLEDKNSSLLVDKEKYQHKIQTGNCLLSQITTNYLIADYREDNSPVERENPLQTVSRCEGAYGISRKVNPLQRLFDGRVLRDFDIRLTETKQESHRTKSLLNRRFCYDGITYEIIEDDGSDIILAQEIYSSTESKKNQIETIKTRKFSVVDLKSKIQSDSYSNCRTYWIE